MAHRRRQRKGRPITHKLGDLLWRDKVGWAVCLEEKLDRARQSIKVRLKGAEKNVMAGFYVNVSEVCHRNSVLAGLIEELRRVVVAKMADSNESVLAG